MRGRTIVAASIAALTIGVLGMPGSVKAQGYGNWCSDGYTAYFDPTGRSVQSPRTCIFPAANWSYFFHRVRHYGPVLRTREPDYRWRWWMLY
ncbi:hypothetical protein [Bradyrhizobium sp. ARR65]|uniref:hypothetical protein n=1 Tax=Bradyrhizobium sp. ARR65 TaxID=1040989 RepID=UPI000A59F913|nr:hypothetical protein [Bradyrhizobium sp. ARR65]